MTQPEDDVLDQTFETDSPETLEGLVLEVPDEPGAEPEYFYDFRSTTRQRIRCAHCGWENHLAGYVVKTPSGKRFLVGHDCGDNLYDGRFAQNIKDFSARRDQVLNLRRLRSVERASPAFSLWLQRTARSEAWSQYHGARRELREFLPELWGILSTVAEKQQGELRIDEQVRDHAAEERAEKVYEEEHALYLALPDHEKARLSRTNQKPRRPKAVFKVVSRVVGHLPTRSFFERRSGLHAHQRAAISSIQAAVGTALTWRREGEGFSDQEVDELFRSLYDALDGLERDLDLLDEAVDFFQPAVIAAVALWANATVGRPGAYRAEGTTIVKSDETYRQLRLPGDYAPPTKIAIAEFRAAIRAGA